MTLAGFSDLEDEMISAQSTTLIDDIAHLLGDLEDDANKGPSERPVMKDIRAVRRDLDALEREVLETAEHEGLSGDAC